MRFAKQNAGTAVVYAERLRTSPSLSLLRRGGTQNTMNKFEKQFRKPTHEQSQAELFLTKLGLHTGVLVRLVKISSEKESKVETGDALEGVLDQDVVIGKPIYFDGKSKNTSNITAVEEEGDRIFFKTNTSVYELVPPTEKSNVIKSKEFLEIERKIDIALKNAQDAALDNVGTDNLFQQRISLYQRERTPQVLEEIKKLDEQIKKHIISVDTLVEFKILMNKLGKNYYRVNSTVYHENAHANKASSIGAIHQDYTVLVSKSKKGNGFAYQPFARTDVPNSWPKHRQIEAKIKIGSAPEEYGNALSDGDEKMIEILRQQLKDN